MHPCTDAPDSAAMSLSPGGALEVGSVAVFVCGMFTV